MAELQKILNAPKYKTIKEKVLNNLLEIYKENTNGIVPPTYIKAEEEKSEETLPEDEEK